MLFIQTIINFQLKNPIIFFYKYTRIFIIRYFSSNIYNNLFLIYIGTGYKALVPNNSKVLDFLRLNYF